MTNEQITRRAQLIASLDKVQRKLQETGYVTAAAHVRDAESSIKELPADLDLGV